MNKKRLTLIIAGLVIAGVIAWKLLRSGALGNTEPLAQVDSLDFDRSKCPAGELSLTMGDVYMRGILEKGQSFRTVLNWYACNPPASGDLVLFRISPVSEPVVRRVVAVPGDKINVVKDESDNGWNLEINGSVVETEGRPYFFGADVPPPLSLYAKSRDGQIRDGEIIVFSSFPPGESDSGTLGAVSLKDVLGKVETL